MALDLYPQAMTSGKRAAQRKVIEMVLPKAAKPGHLEEGRLVSAAGKPLF